MQLAGPFPEPCLLRPTTCRVSNPSYALFCRQPCAPSCSYTSRVHTGSSNPTATAAVRSPKHRRRTSTIAHAWFGSQPTRQLWNYQGSYVRKLSLAEHQLLHRLSFGHRNQRSYLIILYQPNSQACQDFEAEVERLATGLRHERSFVAAALDTSSREAADFATKMLGVTTVPAVLLYPEAARGCLRFLGPDMSAAGMLTAINNARQKALPPTATSPGAAEWQLIEAGTPLAVTAVRAAAASGNTEALLTTLQQQMAPIQPTPLEVQSQTSIWSQGRLTFWGGMIICSLLFLAWDLKLSDVWEDWNLLRRQQERASGKRFTFAENFDDFTTILMAGIANRQRPDMLPEQQIEQQLQQRLQQQLQQQQQQEGRPVGGGSSDVQQELDKQQYSRAGMSKAEQQQQRWPGDESQAGAQQTQEQQQQEWTMKQQQSGSWVVDQSKQ